MAATKEVNRAPFGAVFGKACWFGLITGIVTGWVKLGWEQLFPPRTLSRGVSNEPQYLLQQLGVPYDVTHATIPYADNPISWVALCVHFSFSIFFSILFILLVQKLKFVALWEGAAYGIALWIAFHLVILPLIGNVPPMWGQPWTELCSECFGHIAWAWAIAAISFYLISKQRKKTLINPDIGWGFDKIIPSANRPAPTDEVKPFIEEARDEMVDFDLPSTVVEEEHKAQ